MTKNKNMQRLIQSIILIFVVINMVFGQPSKQDTSQQNLGVKIEKLERTIEKESQKTEQLNDRSKDNLEFASKLVDWTGVFFAAIAAIFLIASIVGFKEIAEIRNLKNDMKAQYEQIQSELSDIQLLKKEILQDNLFLKNKIEKESTDFLRIIYLSNQGLTNYHAGKLYDAESNFKNILKINPNDYRALCYLARIYFGQNKYTLALETITKATSIGENSHFAHSIMGEIFRMIGRLDEAVIAFKKSISLEPQPATYSSLGYAYFKKEDYENAINAFQSAIELRRYSTPICGLAKALMKSGQMHKSMKYFEETIILAEEDIRKGSIYIWPYYTLTFSLFVKNRKKECLKYLKISLERNDNPGIIKEQLDQYKSMTTAQVPQDLLAECITLFEKKIKEIA